MDGQRSFVQKKNPQSHMKREGILFPTPKNPGGSWIPTQFQLELPQEITTIGSRISPKLNPAEPGFTQAGFKIRPKLWRPPSIQTPA